MDLAAAGRYDESIAVLRRHLITCQKTGDRSREGQSLLMLGALLVDTGQYMEGIRVSQRAADCLAMEGDAQRRSIALNQLEKARRGLRGLGGPTSVV
jgi:hypothetical protein